MGTINMLGLAKRVKARILMASTRKVRVVLFYHVNICGQYAFIELSLPLCYYYYKPYVLTNVAVISLLLRKLLNADLPVRYTVIQMYILNLKVIGEMLIPLT